MKTALLIHGYNGIPQIFQYFAQELPKFGYQVIMPALPTREEISFSAWSEILQNNYSIENIDLLIAHSIGNEFMIRYCAKFNLRIKKYIGLAGFAETFSHTGRDDLNQVIAAMQCSQSEVERFKMLTEECYAIYSNDDHIVPLSVLENYAAIISATPIIIPNIGHMGKKSGLTELPQVIDLVRQENR